MPSRPLVLCLAALVACASSKDEPDAPGPSGTAPTLELDPFSQIPTVCDDAPILFTGASTGLEGVLPATLTLDGVPSSFDLVIAADGSFAIDASVLSSPLAGLCGDGACTLEAVLTVSPTDGPVQAEASLDVDDDRRTGFVDADADGYGDGPSIQACPDVALVPIGDDCDDSDPLTYPGAPERCDAIDNDCDTFVDNDVVQVSYYADTDGDGYGAGAPLETTCDGPSDPSYVDNVQDCLPSDPSSHPGALELCDGVDNDCDGQADDSDPQGPDEGLEYYLDSDGDGFFTDQPIVQCAAPTTSPFQTTPPDPALVDCNDASVLFRPDDTDGDGASTCAGDCDGDDPALNLLDEDGDAFTSCGGDCNDADDTWFPGGYDIPIDGIDQNCDGLDDCYIDSDGDGFAPDATAVPGANLLAGDACDDPYNGFASVLGDCDDSARTVGPGLAEIVGDGIDQSCDGLDACFVDDDNDDYSPDGTAVASVQANLMAGETCASLPFAAPYRFDIFDCDDANASVNPSASDVPGTDTDEDCDGLYACFADPDNDGFHAGDGALNLTTATPCSTPGNFGTSAVGDPDTYDCAPQDPNVYPGAVEIVGNGIDEDCDAQLTCFADGDGDGFGDTGTVLVSTFDAGSTGCVYPGAADNADDCAGSDPLRYPGAPEVACDGIAQDCSSTQEARVAILQNPDEYTFALGDETFPGLPAEQLAAALAAAQPLDTVMLCSGETYPGAFEILTEVRIQGNGATLDGGTPLPSPGSCAPGSAPVLQVAAMGQTTLVDLTLTGGCADPAVHPHGGGLAITEFGTQVIGDQLTVTRNAAQYGGGVSVQDGARFEVLSGQFDANRALDGGAIWGGPGSDLVLGSATGLTTVFAGNEAVAGSGGAIYAPDQLALVNATVSGNVATDAGGGLFLSGTGGLEAVAFSANEATDGGGMYVSGSCNAEVLELSDNTASDDGGGMWVGGVVSITGLQLFTNAATRGNTAYIEGAGQLFYDVGAFGGASEVYCADSGDTFPVAPYTFCDPNECLP